MLSSKKDLKLKISNIRFYNKKIKDRIYFFLMNKLDLITSFCDQVL